jgi:hypothetical protein
VFANSTRKELWGDFRGKNKHRQIQYNQKNAITNSEKNVGIGNGNISDLILEISTK